MSPKASECLFGLTLYIYIVFHASVMGLSVGCIFSYLEISYLYLRRRIQEVISSSEETQENNGFPLP